MRRMNWDEWRVFGCLAGTGLVALAVAVGCEAGNLNNHPEAPTGQAGTSASAVAGTGGSAFPGGTRGGAGTGGTFGSTGGTVACDTISTTPEVSNHCGRTVSVAYSPDGQTLATGSEARAPNVQLWSLDTGARVRDLEGVGQVTYSVAFSPDGKLLATAGETSDQVTVGAFTGGIVKLWDLTSGLLVGSVSASCGFYADSVAFSHDGSLLVTAGYNGPVELWRVTDATRVASIPYPTSVHNVHFAPDDSRLIVAGVDQRVTVWKLPEATLLFTLDGTADEQADGAFSPNGALIATTGLGNTVKIWDAAAGTLLQTLTGHNAYVSRVLWIDDGRLVSDDWSGMIRLWQADAAGQFSATKLWSVGGQALGMALSPDKARVAIAENDGIFFLAP